MGIQPTNFNLFGFLFQPSEGLPSLLIFVLLGDKKTALKIDETSPRFLAFSETTQSTCGEKIGIQSSSIRDPT